MAGGYYNIVAKYFQYILLGKTVEDPPLFPNGWQDLDLTEMYIALLYEEPDPKDGAAGPMPEIEGGGYTRYRIGSETQRAGELWGLVSTDPTSGDFQRSKMKNLVNFEWPTATSDWARPAGAPDGLPKVTHFTIGDKSTATTTSYAGQLFWGSLESSKTIENGDTPVFAAGNLTIQSYYTT